MSRSQPGCQGDGWGWADSPALGTHVLEKQRLGSTPSSCPLHPSLRFPGGLGFLQWFSKRGPRPAAAAHCLGTRYKCRLGVLPPGLLNGKLEVGSVPCVLTSPLGDAEAGPV